MLLMYTILAMEEDEPNSVAMDKERDKARSISLAKEENKSGSAAGEPQASSRQIL